MDYVDYLRLYGRLSLVNWREVGVSWMDNAFFKRSLHSSISVGNIEELNDWRRFNWYISNASSIGEKYSEGEVVFDRIAFDFDYEDNPNHAINAAIRFAELINERFNAVVLVARSGFKGAYAYLFLSRPVDWPTASGLFNYLRLLSPEPRLIDANMNQWNRLARIPLSFNNKHGEGRLVEVIYPERVSDYRSFTWSLIKPLDPSLIRIESIKLPQLPQIRTITHQRASLKWVEELIRSGVRDGRKRIIALAIMPYLANYLNLPDAEVLARCREFIENSCRNHNNCSKIHDTWLRSQLKTVKNHKYKVISRMKLIKEIPELKNTLTDYIKGK